MMRTAAARSLGNAAKATLRTVCIQVTMPTVSAWYETSLLSSSLLCHLYHRRDSMSLPRTTSFLRWLALVHRCHVPARWTLVTIAGPGPCPSMDPGCVTGSQPMLPCFQHLPSFYMAFKLLYACRYVDVDSYPVVPVEADHIYIFQDIASLECWHQIF
jgi:hypothetical protein